MERVRSIATVDFSAYSLNINDDLKDVADQLCAALSTTGFCYLKNHGFSDTLIESFRRDSYQFFQESKDVKQKYARNQTTNHGWVDSEGEMLNPERPPDLKEMFNICFHSQRTDLPDTPSSFKENIELFFDECVKLTKNILDALSRGLNLGDYGYLRRCHEGIGKEKNYSTLRTLFYPTIPHVVKPGQIRCGEHSDYGTITLLFQDDIGGLQVLGKDGVFLDVEPVRGTVLLNIGDALQRWTADRLLATKHRVVVPDSELKRKICRQSIVFFVHPDDDVIMECLDGSKKYEPIESGEYTKQKFSGTY